MSEDLTKLVGMQQNTEATVEFLKAIAGFGLFILGISAISNTGNLHL